MLRDNLIDPIFLDCLTLEDGINRLSRNDGNYQPTLRNILEKRWFHLHRACNPKSRCRSVMWQQLCMSDACKFTQLLVFNFTHTYCVCVRVLTNKLYTHIHTAPRTYIEPITIVGTVGRRVRTVKRLIFSTRWQKKLHYFPVQCKSHVDYFIDLMLLKC